MPDRYPADFTDDEWLSFQPFSRKAGIADAPRKHDLRRIIDGCLFVLRGGIAWRMMPHDLPPWTDRYDRFRRWRKSGKREAGTGQRGAARAVSNPAWPQGPTNGGRH